MSEEKWLFHQTNILTCRNRLWDLRVSLSAHKVGLGSNLLHSSLHSWTEWGPQLQALANSTPPFKGLKLATIKAWQSQLKALNLVTREVYLWTQCLPWKPRIWIQVSSRWSRTLISSKLSIPACSNRWYQEEFLPPLSKFLSQNFKTLYQQLTLQWSLSSGR